MFIIIKDIDKINHYTLDKDIKYKGIHIYSKNNQYYIELKNGLYFLDNSKSKLLQIGQYDIRLENAYYQISIYVYDDCKGINDYKLYKNINFLIANNPKASIVCKDRYLKDYYLAYKDGLLNSNYDVLVNSCRYSDTLLKQGDIIEYLGIRIIYFDDFLYINQFNIDINLPIYNPIKTSLKYKDTINRDNYYIPEDIYEFEIEEIKEYELPKKPNIFDFIKSIIPNSIMFLAMGAMAIINYFNNLDSSNSNILTFILMPISMLITSILVPIVFMSISNSKYSKDCSIIKNNYIQYLNEYEDNLKDNINKYIQSLNTRCFNLFDSKKMMFYASSNSDEFMKISIGHIKISKKIKVNKTSDDEINTHLKQIEKIANNIEDYPIYLDIKKSHKTTVITKRIDKLYYFNSYLLETSYKHHYEDINIGIYSKDKNIFNNIYNLPHLFIGNRRLTLNSEEQLQALDQEKLNKPLILFLYDKCEHYFTNDNIYVIYFSKDISDLLKDSSIIVNYLNKQGSIYDNKKQSFKYTRIDIDFDSYFQYIGRFIKVTNTDSNYQFNKVFNDNICDYNLSDNHSLKATFAYDKNELISLDLHESKQGPHGLIGGATGSGKSELIVSLLLSLCIRYSPEYLNIVLIDYKGGGLKESLSFCNEVIPHLVASVSNLENNALDRLIIALHNECKYRQELFKKLSQVSNISVMNLDDYIDNNHNNLPKIAHLLIVVDEFAELKKEKSEQIKELISLSRIGRSLGLHLILATQKPAGVIDDEIWSNSRFKIALKVFDEKDSTDIVKTKDAAYLHNPGSFIMHIDGGLTMGQSMYSKCDINGNDPYKVSTLTSELLIDKTYKNINSDIKTASSYFCEKIIDASRNLSIRKLEYMPPIQKPRQLLTKTNCLLFGEVDDYINSRKGLLGYKIDESLLIYSSRKTEINSILNSLNEAKRKSVVIGSKVYKGSYISDSILYDNHEDIDYLLKYLFKNRNNNLTLLIEDISCLLSYDENYIELFNKLIKRKDSLNLSLIFLTSTSQINFKIINGFNNKIMINIVDSSDLSAFYGTRGIYKGNSYFYLDTPISFVPIIKEKYIESEPLLPNIIKRIPEYIEKDIKNNEYLLGYAEETKEPVYYSEDINVVSLDQELLNAYQVSYPEIKTYLYNYSFRIEDNSPILWLGRGIFNQRLFITGFKDDIDSNQGILFTSSKTILIRRINNV